MILIDTHTHLYLPHFADDIEQVIHNAVNNHVGKMLLPNIDDSSVGPMLELCNRYPLNCHPMIGLHPASVNEDYMDKLRVMETLLGKEEFVAVGETGMDAYWDTEFIKQQEDAFIIQLEWAKTRDLPVVIHSRMTMDRILRIIRSFRGNVPGGVFHAFSGTKEEACEAIEMGYKLGIGGVVTYRNSGLDKLVKSIDLKHILLETDSPYLTPVPYRGKRNESARITGIAAKISEIKELSIEEVASVTTGNAIDLFKLKKK